MQVTPPTPERPLAVRGTLLRSILLLELDLAAGSTVTVAQLCEALHRRGFTVRGRPSKVVSDVLRTELNRDRVRRTGRGRYCIGRLPRTTRWRCRARVRDAQAGRVPALHLVRGTAGRERALVVERFAGQAGPRRRRVVANNRNGGVGGGASWRSVVDAAGTDPSVNPWPTPPAHGTALEARDPPH